MASYIGLDLGGTNIKAGVVDDSARVLSRKSVPTPTDRGMQGVVEALVDVAGEVASRAGVTLKQIEGIGVGSPGAIDVKAGVIAKAGNLPGFVEVPLAKLVSEKTGRPTFLENDANAAAFGEYWAGAGSDDSIRHMVMLTLGTGIGSGLIVNGMLVHGANGFAGEGGHMIVQPGGRAGTAGSRGTLENYASATHTALRAKEAIETDRLGPDSLLNKILIETGDLTTKDVFDAAESSDILAMKIVDETAMYLAIACVNFCRVLDPQMIVFAGGVIAAGEALFGPIRSHFEHQTWNLTEESARIVPAELGNDAGFIGAAAVARQAVGAAEIDADPTHF